MFEIQEDESSLLQGASGCRVSDNMVFDDQRYTPESNGEYVSTNKNKIKTNPFTLMPAIMDFLRKVALFRGRVVFIENHSEWESLEFAN